MAARGLGPALPDLRGRTFIHVGRSNGGGDHRLGRKSGEETHTLAANKIPQHDHGTGEPLTADLTGQVYTGAPVTISGLAVTQSYYVSPTDSVLRTFASFTNPGGTDIAVALRWQHNLGADSNTRVVGSASGDTTFTIEDG